MDMTDQNQVEDTRRRIIQGAIRLFGRIGYKRATTRAIAVESDVNEVTIFRHFGSKKNLLAACVESFNAAGFAESFGNHLTGDYEADIKWMAKAQMEDMVANFQMLRMFMCDSVDLPELREAGASGASGNLNLIVNYFQDQIEDGIVREILVEC